MIFSNNVLALNSLISTLTFISLLISLPFCCPTSSRWKLITEFRLSLITNFKILCYKFSLQKCFGSTSQTWTCCILHFIQFTCISLCSSFENFFHAWVIWKQLLSFPSLESSRTESWLDPLRSKNSPIHNSYVSWGLFYNSQCSLYWCFRNIHCCHFLFISC